MVAITVNIVVYATDPRIIIKYQLSKKEQLEAIHLTMSLAGLKDAQKINIAQNITKQFQGLGNYKVS